MRLSHIPAAALVRHISVAVPASTGSILEAERLKKTALQQPHLQSSSLQHIEYTFVAHLDVATDAL